jgi:hypothetical protein
MSRAPRLLATKLAVALAASVDRQSYLFVQERQGKPQAVSTVYATYWSS